MKKGIPVILAAFLLIFCLCPFPCKASYNSAFVSVADVVFLMSLDDGSVIFDKNADRQVAPASLTKIATAALTIENCPDPDEVVTVKKSSIAALGGTGSSMAGLLPGEELSVRDLLYCLLVRSGNDAAMVLADYVSGGDIPAFVERMNAFAQSVGCEHTHFVNPHGLDDPGQYTTARDLSKLVRCALDLPGFAEITDTHSYRLPATNKQGERSLLSTNWLINPNFKTYYYPYAQGIKTGRTKAAGHCIVSKASRDGYNYLGIVMGAPELDVNGDGSLDNLAFLECKRMFEWAFENIRFSKISDPLQVATVVDVRLSWKTDHVRLVPESEVTALVPVGTDSGSVLLEVIPEETPKTVDAPVKKGQVLGKARILYAQEKIATVNLVAAEDVRLSIPLWLWNGLKTLCATMVFRIVFGSAAALLLLYILLIVRHNRRKARRKPRVVRNFRDM